MPLVLQHLEMRISSLFTSRGPKMVYHFGLTTYCRNVAGARAHYMQYRSRCIVKINIMGHDYVFVQAATPPEYICISKLESSSNQSHWPPHSASKDQLSSSTTTPATTCMAITTAPSHSSTTPTSLHHQTPLAVVSREPARFSTSVREREKKRAGSRDSFALS